MKRVIVLSCVASSLVSAIVTLLVVYVAVPRALQAQQAKIQALGVAVVDDNGTERVSLSTGPGVRASVSLLDANGTNRVDLGMGGPNGTNPATNGANVSDVNGTELARLGTGTAKTPARSVLRLADGAGNPRVLLAVADDGTPSIQLLDADGNVTWSAP